MHALRILPRCLPDVFNAMHLARARRLLHAVEALIARRVLTLTELARSWPGELRVHAPLKALDRLLSNAHLHAELKPLSQAMARHLLLGRPHPLILVDWSDLKEDGRWVLLRAGVPVGGRTLTLHQRIYPARYMNNPSKERVFLKELETIVPCGVVPIVVTDAGFRSGWMRSVRALGWHFIGRVRSNVQVQLDDAAAWSPCTHLYKRARRTAWDLGDARIVKGEPLDCRLVLVKRAAKGRTAMTRKGTPRQGKEDKRARKSAEDPWLLATSLDPETMRAALVVSAYSQRMQIESSFRDLKSEQYGVGFLTSQTRGASRLAVLLMLQTLACFAAWALSLAQRALPNLPDPLTRQAKHRRRYSWLRRAIEWLRAVVLPAELRRKLDDVLQQDTLAGALP